MGFTVDELVVGLCVFKVGFFVIDVLGFKGNQHFPMLTPIQFDRSSLGRDNVINSLDISLFFIIIYFGLRFSHSLLHLS